MNTRNNHPLFFRRIHSKSQLVVFTANNQKHARCFAIETTQNQTLLLYFSAIARKHTSLFSFHLEHSESQPVVLLISLKITVRFFPLTLLKITARCFFNENTRNHNRYFPLK